MARQGFVIYHGEYDQLGALTDAEFRAVFDALRRYSETGDAAALSGAARMAFGFMARSIDGDEARYQARCERSQRANDARWGKMRKDADASEGSTTHPSDPNPNPNPNPNSNPNTNPNANDRGEACASPPQERRFSPPSPDEIAAYCRERGNRVDPVKFRDHYEANGWMIGKSPMKNWRAAVRLWERSDYGNGRAHDVDRRGDPFKPGDPGDHGKPRPRIPGEVVL